MLGILNIAIFSIALGIGVGLLIHLIEQRTPERGQYLAFVPFLGGFLGFALLLHYLSDSEWDQARAGFYLFMPAAIWVERIAWLVRRGRLAGPLLLDLGRPQQHYQDMNLTIGILLILAAILIFLATDLTMKGIVLSIFCFSILAPSLMGKLSKLEIREHGIWHSDGLIKWGWIESYQWESDGGNTLTAWVRRPSFIRAWSWSIAPFQKEVLSSLLAQHLPLGDKGR